MYVSTHNRNAVQHSFDCKQVEDILEYKADESILQQSPSPVMNPL